VFYLLFINYANHGAQLKKVNTMKKSYVNELSMTVKVDIDLGELGQIIQYVSAAVNDETATSNYRAKELLKNLKRLEVETAEEAIREFQRIAQNA
tara:strand:+ start:56 stop:340 length:285 start_codon:yes stop_codon:yes gene_type:complete